MAVHAWNPSTQKAETGALWGFGEAWATYGELTFKNKGKGNWGDGSVCKPPAA